MSTTLKMNVGLKRWGQIGLTSLLMLLSSHGWALDFSDIAERAKKLSQQSYSTGTSSIPKALQDLKFGDYQKIQPNMANALWADDKLPFRVSFFHPGMHFTSPVTIHQVDAQGTTKIPFKTDFFTVSSPDISLDQLDSNNLDFAGFRIHYPINNPDHFYDELASFLGASYFRMVGAGQTYGLSARGLAIDTALPSGEIFPVFKEYWLMRPARGDKHIILYALLDSPKATGAYRFTITPGSTTISEVRAKLFFRDTVGKLGLAPASSMFLYGTTQAPAIREYRPELHDSDGLAMVTGSGEQLWRPLNNPRRIALSAFSMENPKGFGLQQRGREFSRYEDIADHYEMRPSMWIEPREDWGKGRVELLELPTDDETNDNIAVMWVPEIAPKKGDTLDLSYNIYWTTEDTKFLSPKLAHVVQTIRTTGEVRGNDLVRRSDGTVALMIDFQAPTVVGAKPNNAKAIANNDLNLVLRADISSNDNIQILSHEIIKNPARQGYRLEIKLAVKDKDKVSELRAQLFNQDTPWSEVWTYQITNNESK